MCDEGANNAPFRNNISPFRLFLFFFFFVGQQVQGQGQNYNHVDCNEATIIVSHIKAEKMCRYLVGQPGRSAFNGADEP